MDNPYARFPGYTEVWVAAVFGEMGMFAISIHQKEDARKKMSEKAFLNFASNFIRYNY